MCLRLDWCSHEAAKYAVEHWHYSGSMPAGKITRIGVWEDSEYIGAVVFSRGSNKYLGQPFGLEQIQCVELARVALRTHVAPVSRILSISCRLLRELSPGLRLVISFADPHRGHIGTIYQAANWIFSGCGTADPRSQPYRNGGRIYHWRTVAGELAKRGLHSTTDAARSLGFRPMGVKPKYRYLYPLDPAMRAQIEPLRKPYPKRAASIAVDALGHQPGEGSSTLTAALQD